MTEQGVDLLRGHVHKDAELEILDESSCLRQSFLNIEECNGFVMSVDIRRSTALMLKARDPRRFANFIVSACTLIADIVKNNYGIFIDSAGDGVLAFFPEFYSGEDAAYHVLMAADQCHEAFQKHYEESRRLFWTVLLDVGLGIGVDHGRVHLVQAADGGLKVVGPPVVYACRLASAPFGSTFVNQPASEIIMDNIGSVCSIIPTSIEIKYEGAMLAYDVKLNDRKPNPRLPGWRKD